MNTQTDSNAGLHLIEWVEPDGVKIGIDTKLPGARDHVTKEERDRYVGLGWARCCATGEQGERKPGVAEVAVDQMGVSPVRRRKG